MAKRKERRLKEFILSVRAAVWAERLDFLEDKEKSAEELISDFPSLFEP